MFVPTPPRPEPNPPEERQLKRPEVPDPSPTIRGCLVTLIYFVAAIIIAVMVIAAFIWLMLASGMWRYH